MKKILFIALGLFITGLASGQQIIFGPKSDYVTGGAYDPKISIQVGTNISTAIFVPNSVIIAAPIHGYNAGLSLIIPCSPLIDLTPGISFSQKGFMGVTLNGNFTQRTQFTEVPFLVKFKVNPIVSLFVGPQFSYLLSTKNTFDAGFVTATEPDYDNNNIKNYWVGVGGASFTLFNHFELHARYTIDLQTTPSNGDPRMPDYKNQAWQFGLGYKF